MTKLFITNMKLFVDELRKLSGVSEQYADTAYFCNTKSNPIKTARNYYNRFLKGENNDNKQNMVIVLLIK